MFEDKTNISSTKNCTNDSTLGCSWCDFVPVLVHCIGWIVPFLDDRNRNELYENPIWPSLQDSSIMAGAAAICCFLFPEEKTKSYIFARFCALLWNLQWFGHS